MVFKPGAVVYHRHPATLSRYLRVKFWRGYWRMIVYRRHPRKAVADSYTPNVLKIQTMLMALSFILLPISFLVRNVFIWILWLCTGVMVLAIPFSIKAYRRDRCVGVIALWIILLRSMVFAAGIFTGILSGTKMLDAMAQSFIHIIPDSLGPNMAVITGITSMPFTYFISNDAYFYGIAPLTAVTAAHFGVPAIEIGRASLLGQSVHMLSPLVASTYLLVGLAGVSFDDHQRFTMKWAVATTLVMLLVSILTGAISIYF